MTPPTAAKIIDLIEHNTPELPEVLAIDEFRGNAEGENVLVGIITIPTLFTEPY